jgi:hypothetical protein
MRFSKSAAPDEIRRIDCIAWRTTLVLRSAMTVFETRAAHVHRSVKAEPRSGQITSGFAARGASAYHLRARLHVGTVPWMVVLSLR